MSETALVASSPELRLRQPDVIAAWLNQKCSGSTKKAYAWDLGDFFKYVTGTDQPPPELVREFLALKEFDAVALVLEYQNYLLKERSLQPTTVNRRLAAIKALVKFAHRLHLCDYTLTEVKPSKIEPYRDTTGISREAYRSMLAIPDRTTLKGKRDYAILRLLWDNALRRAELVQANIADVNLERRTLLIQGKGQQQKQMVSLSLPTVKAVTEWLQGRSVLDDKQPLFISLERNSFGHRLSGIGIYKLIDKIGQRAGISKKLSPHRIRHSSITAALDASAGDVRRVQKFSRHADLNTLLVYDDNRQNVQGEISDLVADLV